MAKTGVVISVFNEKGGSGKTTTTCQLAAALGRRGYEVIVADLDPQGTSAAWIATEGGVNIKSKCWRGDQYGEHIHKELAHHASKYDIVVADCAPSVQQSTTWGALLVSSLAILPTRLGPQDTAALPAAKRMIRKAWEATGADFPARVLPIATRFHLQDDVIAVEHLKKDKEIPLAKTTFGDRKAYQRSMLIGGSVHDVPRAEDSVREVEALTDEVLKLLKLGLHNERLAA